MESKFTFRSYYTPQVDERDCGVAALDMILKYYHSDYSLAHLRQLAKTNLDGTTALGLVKAAQKLNFDVKPIRADIHLFNESDLPFPFIAHVEKKGGILHYYVVFAISGNSLIIGDPDPTVKIIKMPIKTFTSEWTGVAIFFAPNTQYVPKKENKHSLYSFVPLVLKQHKLIINIILSSIMITLISIIGSYFIQMRVSIFMCK